MWLHERRYNLKIHKTQIEVARLILENQDITIREIQKKLNLSTPSLAFHHLQQCKKKGLIPKIYPLRCPLCFKPNMDYKKINERTHIWICPECPAVLFEYYSNDNLEDLKNTL